MGPIPSALGPWVPGTHKEVNNFEFLWAAMVIVTQYLFDNTVVFRMLTRDIS